jgi:hypothetical protein
MKQTSMVLLSTLMAMGCVDGVEDEGDLGETEHALSRPSTLRFAFDETSGSTTTSTGAEVDGTLLRTSFTRATIAPLATNTSALAVPANGHVTLDSHPAFREASLTHSFWFRYDTPGTTSTHVLSYACSNGYQLTLTPDGHLFVAGREGITGRLFGTSIAVESGRWHHIAIAFSTRIVVWKNGVRAATALGTSIHWNHRGLDAPLRIGRNSCMTLKENNGTSFLFDDLRVFPGEITDADARELGERPPAPTNLAVTMNTTIATASWTGVPDVAYRVLLGFGTDPLANFGTLFPTSVSVSVPEGFTSRWQIHAMRNGLLSEPTPIVVSGVSRAPL